MRRAFVYAFIFFWSVWFTLMLVFPETEGSVRAARQAALGVCIFVFGYLFASRRKRN